MMIAGYGDFGRRQALGPFSAIVRDVSYAESGGGEVLVEEPPSDIDGDDGNTIHADGNLTPVFVTPRRTA